MNRICMIGAVAFALTALPSERAQAQVSLGVHGLYNTESVAAADDGFAGVGARLGVGLPVVGLGISGDFNWFFPDCATIECDFYELVANLTYSVLDVAPVSPYFGGGLAYQGFQVDSDVLEDPDSEMGLNLLGGVQVGGVAPINAYGEVSYRIMDQNQLVLTLGLVF